MKTFICTFTLLIVSIILFILFYLHFIFLFFKIKFERGDLIIYDEESFLAARALYSRISAPSSTLDLHKCKVGDESK